MPKALPAKFVYQIFYDARTQELADANRAAGFIPLDNTANLHPDWYEFWVIRRFFQTQILDDHAWYGFLSPQFTAKSGFAPQYVMAQLDEHPDCDVMLFTVGWEQLAYFQNPFEQGEIWHPGLSALSQEFFDAIGLAVDLKLFVTHTLTSVFSNYIVAKASFWRAWLELANQFFNWVETHQTNIAAMQTTYGESIDGTAQLAPMKTFIQERLASVVLSQQTWRVFAPDQSNTCPIMSSMLVDNAQTRAQLRECDYHKMLYCTTGNSVHFKDYYAVRSGMVFLK